MSDILNDWILCGRVEGNKVYSDNLLVGRVERDGDEYFCVLDFTDDKRISLERLEKDLQEYDNSSYDTSAMREITSRMISKAKSHPDEYTVAKTRTSNADTLNKNGFTIVGPMVDYMLKADEFATTPSEIKEQMWFDFPKTDVMLHTRSKDAFELATVFICFQRVTGVKESIRPFFWNVSLRTLKNINMQQTEFVIELGLFCWSVFLVYLIYGLQIPQGE